MNKPISPNELSKIIGVSRQTIYNRMSKDLSKFVKEVDGKKRLDYSVLDYLGIDQTVKEPSNDFDSIVKALTRELDIKNAQIEALTQQNKELTAALQNTTNSLMAAQALHANTVQQQRLTDNNSTAENSTKKRHWWNRKNKGNG